jgi:hypothetical protein
MRHGVFEVAAIVTRVTTSLVAEAPPANIAVLVSGLDCVKGERALRPDRRQGHRWRRQRISLEPGGRMGRTRTTRRRDHTSRHVLWGMSTACRRVDRRRSIRRYCNGFDRWA